MRAPQSWNRYAYTLGNPLKYTDPFGLQVATFGETITVCRKAATGEPCSPPVTGDLPFDFSGLNNFVLFGSLLRHGGLSGGLPTRAIEILDLERQRTPTIGPAPPPQPQRPVRPDYITGTISVPIPNHYTGTLLGITGNITLDRNGNLYIGIGPNAGKGLFLFSATLVGGGINQSSTMTPEEIQSTLSGVTNNFTIGAVGGSGLSRSGLSGPKSMEFGVMSPTVGVSTTYNWQLWNVGIKW